MQAFRFALDPNAAQEAALRSHCGAARAAYNWAVGWVTASWWQRHAEESYGVPQAGLTQWWPWSLASLRKAFNAAKQGDPRFAAWWQENSKEAYSTGLATASASFFLHRRCLDDDGSLRERDDAAAMRGAEPGWETPAVPRW